MVDILIDKRQESIFGDESRMSESVIQFPSVDISSEEKSQDAFIILPKPQEFTRAKVDAVERRPAAVLNQCQLLQTLTAQCRADLHKLACARPHHAYVTKEKSKPILALGTPSQHNKRTHNKETWDKKMLRLKVYQRAFSAIVIHFKAYSPALFDIKKTYEDMLSYRINQIKLAHFEKKRLHIRKHNMRDQMANYQFPENAQLLKAEKYLAILRQRIGLQDEAIKVITGILNKMEESLSDHYERHRDLEEQIIMVDSEIANRRQKAFSMREKEEKEVKEKEGASNTDNNNTLTVVDSDEEDADDPYYNMEDVDEERRMVWIMAFAICHKDLEEAEKKLAFLQTKFQHVVPRHEHESMKLSIKDEKVTAKALTDEKASLEEEITYLKEKDENLNAELEETKTTLRELGDLVTPRPSWEDFADFIQGGKPKWDKMIYGRSTKEVAEKLFNEMRTRGVKIDIPWHNEKNCCCDASMMDEEEEDAEEEAAGMEAAEGEIEDGEAAAEGDVPATGAEPPAEESPAPAATE